MLTALAIGIVGSFLAAVVYDSLPRISVRIAKLAYTLTPRPLREQVDPYADTVAAIEFIPSGEETRFSVFRLALGALMLGVPRLLILHLAVTLKLVVLHHTVRADLASCHGDDAKVKPAKEDGGTNAIVHLVGHGAVGSDFAGKLEHFLRKGQTTERRLTSFGD